jgi:hypothetical protein
MYGARRTCCAEPVSYVRATRVLWILLGLAVLVSVVHYGDNYASYGDYPLSEDLPNPSRSLVAVGWFVFPAAGVVGALLGRRRRITAAAVALAGYSASGLIGFGHYAAPGATDMVWWRQAHIVADIACGLAVLGFALWAAWRAPTLTGPVTPTAA